MVASRTDCHLACNSPDTGLQSIGQEGQRISQINKAERSTIIACKTQITASDAREPFPIGIRTWCHGGHLMPIDGIVVHEVSHFLVHLAWRALPPL